MRKQYFDLPLAHKGKLQAKCGVYLLGNLLVFALVYLIPWMYLTMKALMGTLVVIVPLLLFFIAGCYHAIKRLNKLTYKFVIVDASGIHFYRKTSSVLITWQEINGMYQHGRQRGIIFTQNGKEVCRIDCALKNCEQLLEKAACRIYQNHGMQKLFMTKRHYHVLGILFFFIILMFTGIMGVVARDWQLISLAVIAFSLIFYLYTQLPPILQLIFEADKLKVKYWRKVLNIPYDQIGQVRLTMMLSPEVLNKNRRRWSSYYPIIVQFNVNEKMYSYGPLNFSKNGFLLYQQLAFTCKHK